MRSILDPFYTALGVLGALFILATLVVEVAGIAGRELGYSMAGLDSYAGYCLAAGSFLAMAHALRRGDHIRVTLILTRLKGRTRYWMEVLCLCIAALLSAYFAYFSARLVWGSYTLNDVSQNVDATPLWIPQLSMAIGLFGLAVAFAEQLFVTLRTGRLAPGTDEAAHVE
ncbi:MAG: TRAP transporter small permease [Burkholderiaceae bacterium]|jgi:TRAP-type C4-dicarboxylate transport system permease small subunit|nr:TRAP transporter small permease [Burkholderiaceae bacterium]